MFASTDIRHRAKTDFLTSYEHNCALRNALPVKYVLAGIGGDTLIADVAKIRAGDWPPLLQSIGTASTLRVIELYSTWDGKKPVPVAHQHANTVTRQLTCAIQQLTARRNQLVRLSIVDMHLDLAATGELGAALSGEFCHIEVFTLRNCRIGDVGYSKLNKPIRTLTTLTTLDMSACDLSNAAIVMLTDTLRTKTLHVTGETWVDNLRINSPRSGFTPTTIRQLTRLVLNKNAKITNSIVELLRALTNEEVTCIEELECRECDIGADSKINQTLADLLHAPPPRLKLFDMRVNAILDDPESKTLVQLIMSKLLSRHPYVEYTDITLPPTSSNTNNKQRRKSKIKQQLQATFDVKNNSSDEYDIDTQFQELPSSKKTRESVSQLQAKVDKLEAELRMAEQARTGAIQRYHDLSYRVDELEELIDGKNERITQLENGQEGYVMVEEDLLHHVELSFANFQDFLNKLNQLGLGQLTKMVETAEPINEDDLAQVRQRILSSDSYLTTS